MAHPGLQIKARNVQTFVVLVLNISAKIFKKYCHFLIKILGERIKGKSKSSRE
jgi:hypothetical protein